MNTNPAQLFDHSPLTATANVVVRDTAEALLTGQVARGMQGVRWVAAHMKMGGEIAAHPRDVERVLSTAYAVGAISLRQWITWSSSCRRRAMRTAIGGPNEY